MLKQTTVRLLVTILVVLGLVACTEAEIESAVNESGEFESAVSETTGTPGVDTPNFENVEINDDVFVDPESPAINGSWLSNCGSTGITQNTRELIVIDGAKYERRINLYQDSDCSMPADLSYIFIHTSEFKTTGSTVPTPLGTASRMTISPFELEADSLSGDDLALFDPAICFYDYYLLATDDHLYFDCGTYPPIPDTEEHPLGGSLFFTRQ